MEIIFAHPTYAYDSYTDYRTLVKLAGFETCRVSEIDLGREAFYIVSPINGEFRPHMDYRRSLGMRIKAKIAWWNLERPDSGPMGPTDALERAARSVTDDVLKYADCVWVSDRYYQSLDPRAIYVTMGSDARLAVAKPKDPKAFDVIHLSYLTYRREWMTVRLAEQGVKIAPNAWDPQRVELLTVTRAMLNIHQTPAPIAEPLRFALAAAYMLPLLTEDLKDPYPMKDHAHILSTPYDKIIENVRYWLTDADLATIGEALHHLLCYRFNFKDCVAEGVRESLKRIG
jgi:hypothetical protein